MSGGNNVRGKNVRGNNVRGKNVRGNNVRVKMPTLPTEISFQLLMLHSVFIYLINMAELLVI